MKDETTMKTIVDVSQEAFQCPFFLLFSTTLSQFVGEKEEKNFEKEFSPKNELLTLRCGVDRHCTTNKFEIGEPKTRDINSFVITEENIPNVQAESPSNT